MTRLVYPIETGALNTMAATCASRANQAYPAAMLRVYGPRPLRKSTRSRRAALSGPWLHKKAARKNRTAATSSCREWPRILVAASGASTGTAAAAAVGASLQLIKLALHLPQLHFLMRYCISIKISSVQTSGVCLCTIAEIAVWSRRYLSQLIPFFDPFLGLGYPAFELGNILL